MSLPQKKARGTVMPKGGASVTCRRCQNRIETCEAFELPEDTGGKVYLCWDCWNHFDPRE